MPCLRKILLLLTLLVLNASGTDSLAHDLFRTVKAPNQAFSIKLPSDFDVSETRVGVDGFSVYTADGDHSRFTVFEGSQLQDRSELDGYVQNYIDEMKSLGLISSKDPQEIRGDGFIGKLIDWKYGGEHIYMSSLIALSSRNNVIYLVNVTTLDPEVAVDTNDVKRAFDSFTLNPESAKDQQILKNANNLGYAIGYYGPIVLIFLFVFTIFALLIFLLKRD